MEHPELGKKKVPETVIVPEVWRFVKSGIEQSSTTGKLRTVPPVVPPKEAP